MSTTIWLDLDDQKVDVTCLDRRFAEKGYHFIKKQVPAGDEAAAIEMGTQADIVISTWEPWNASTLPAVKGKVKYIVRYGAGLDNIDIAEATAQGIPVGNVPGANSAAVAETALIHILNAGRRFPTAWRDAAGGSGLPLSREMSWTGKSSVFWALAISENSLCA